MKTINGELVKNLREELNLSQEDFADKIAVSVRTLYRIENNKTNFDVFQYIDILRIFNKSVEDYFLLFWDSKEHQEYVQYREKRKSFIQNEYGKFLDSMAETTGVMDDPYVQQVMAFAKIHKTVQDRGDNIHFNPDDLDDWYNAIAITIKDFDEEKVAEYLLVIVETYIIAGIARVLSNTGHHERAIKLINALENNKTIKIKSKTLNILDREIAYVQATSIKVYKAAGMHEEFLGQAQKLIRHRINTGNTMSIDAPLMDSAIAYKNMGEDEFMYKTYFIRAYYCNLLQGANPLSVSEEIAKENFGVELSDWVDF